MTVSRLVNELSRTSAAIEERIRRRAFELYLKRAGQPGSALTDWLEAEEEIRRAQDAAVDEASEESFPASDPPAYR